MFKDTRNASRTNCNIKESKRTSLIGDTEKIMAGNQHRHYYTITKIKWQEYNSGYCRLIYKNDQT